MTVPGTMTMTQQTRTAGPPAALPQARPTTHGGSADTQKHHDPRRVRTGPPGADTGGTEAMIACMFRRCGWFWELMFWPPHCGACEGDRRIGSKMIEEF